VTHELQQCPKSSKNLTHSTETTAHVKTHTTHWKIETVPMLNVCSSLTARVIKVCGDTNILLEVRIHFGTNQFGFLVFVEQPTDELVSRT